MKYRIFAIALATLFCVAACGKKENQASQANEPETAINEPETAMADQPREITSVGESEEPVTDNTPVEASGLQHIRDTWQSQKFAVEPGDMSPGVMQFAFAFCQQYEGFAPNAALLAYLTEPRGYDPEQTGYVIDNKEANGFVSAHGMSQYGRLTDCCYWKCRDGHQLVAFWLYEGTESGDDHLLLFYDYDRTYDLMTPRPALTRMVEDVASHSDNYAVHLPIQGKDLAIDLFTDSGDDSYETRTVRLKWNGDGFDR